MPKVWDNKKKSVLFFFKLKFEWYYAITVISPKLEPMTYSNIF